MKAKNVLVALCALGIFVLGSCSDDDDFQPDNQVVTVFNQMYPQAQKVEWENKSGYKVAEFIFDAKESEAWFDQEGRWVMTETDILFSELPREVQEGYRSSRYSDWRVDDVDKLERPDAGTIYVIEAEQGEEEYDLYYDPDGNLLKEVSEHNSGHRPGNLP